MHINWRATLITIVLLIVLEVGTDTALYFFAQSPMGQATLRDFLVAQERKSAAQAAATAATSTQDLPLPNLLPIPASYANVAYFSAINNVVADLVLVNNANGHLGPLLDQLNQLTLSCSYNGFYDMMGEARGLGNKNQALAAQFVAHLSDLAAANAATKDAILKAQTQTLITSGQAMGAALQAYATGVQSVLYGDIPTSAEVSAFQDRVAAVTVSSQNFANALEPVLSRIVTEDQRIRGASASTTPAH